MPAAALRPLCLLCCRIWMKDGMAIWGVPALQKLSLPAGWNSSTTRGPPWRVGGPARAGKRLQISDPTRPHVSEQQWLADPGANPST